LKGFLPMNNNAEIKHENTDTKKEVERRPYQAPQLIEIDLYSEREVLATVCKGPLVPRCTGGTKS
jgi:hypothetical protein